MLEDESDDLIENPEFNAFSQRENLFRLDEQDE